MEEVRKKAWWVRKKEENTLLSPMLRASICQHPLGHESLPRLLARATGSQPDTQESETAGSLS